jgi:hypothetical protein
MALQTNAAHLSRGPLFYASSSSQQRLVQTIFLHFSARDRPTHATPGGEHSGAELNSSAESELGHSGAAVCAAPRNPVYTYDTCNI